MPQDIHGRMGHSCERSYLICRNQGQDDLLSILMQTAQDLEENWQAEGYEAQAFVNAWDVANYVSDYLTAQAGIEGCACSAKIY